MARAKDLTGQRFGRLVVLREADEPYRSPRGIPSRRWVCRCDCGKEIVVLQNALTSTTRPQQSCGCARREKSGASATDLTGQRFGRLIALERVKADKTYADGVGAVWRCRCDCGIELTVLARNLTSGVTRSCGCLHRETSMEMIANNVLANYDGTRLSMLVSRKPRPTSKTGVRGVYLDTSEQQYIASVTIRGKEIKRRCGQSLEHAKNVRQELFEEYVKPLIEEAKDSGLFDNKEDGTNS